MSTRRPLSARMVEIMRLEHEARVAKRHAESDPLTTWELAELAKRAKTWGLDEQRAHTKMLRDFLVRRVSWELEAKTRKDELTPEEHERVETLRLYLKPRKRDVDDETDVVVKRDADGRLYRP